MKFLGWIFTYLMVAGIGYATCYFGWLEQIISLLKQ